MREREGCGYLVEAVWLLAQPLDLFLELSDLLLHIHGASRYLSAGLPRAQEFFSDLGVIPTLAGYFREETRD
jgi:hypothetical protein